MGLPRRPAAWLALPWALVPIGIGATLSVLLLAGAVSAGRGGAALLDGARGDLVVTQGAIATHAAAMRVLGEQLRAAAASTGSPHREHWIGDAAQLFDDASRLEAVAAVLRDQGQLLGAHPGRSTRSDLSFLRTVGSGIVAEADELGTHGRAMAARPDGSDPSAAPLRDTAAEVVRAASRARVVGEHLLRVGDQLMRSLGR